MELNNELKNINYHIDNFSYGKFELYFRSYLMKEINERGEKKMVREYTNKFLEYIDEGLLTSESVVNMCLKYMSEDEVKDMWESNCLDD